MATTSFDVNDPLTRKVWSKRLYNEMYRKTYVGRFAGESEQNIVCIKNDLKRGNNKDGSGDRITMGLRVLLNGAGVLGDATLEGKEESVDFYSETIDINQLRHASRTNGRMTEQRVPYNLRNVMLAELSDWWAIRMDTGFFNQLCGNTAVTDLRFTGLNPTTAPTANRIIRQGGKDSDQALAAADTFDLTLVDAARERAETASTLLDTGPLIKPIMVNGVETYVMFLHDYQVRIMRNRTETGQWQDIQQAAMQGGDVSKNPIFTGALGMYNNVVLHRASRITQGVHSTTNAVVPNTRRAVLCGAQAVGLAFGSSDGLTKFSWDEETFDYGNQLGVAAGNIHGMKKIVYRPEGGVTANREDYGAVVVSTYATPADTSLAIG